MAEPGKTSRASRVQMTELILPSDANPHGTVFGGRVMQWIDIAAGIAAGRHCRRMVVTASMDELHFHAPILVGEVAMLEARVLATFRTSLEVGVTVHSENTRTGERKLCTSALLTFVALDDERRPVGIPPLEPENQAERRLAEEARARRQARLANRDRRFFEPDEP